MSELDGALDQLLRQIETNPRTTFELGEEERQMILLALALLSLERPGWTWTLGETAAHLAGRELFEEFRRIHAGTEP